MRMLTVAVAAASIGCAAAPKYTQTQLKAIETRVVEARFDDAFNAASGALFDAGYIVTMSDREAGLLTGQQNKTAKGWEFWFGTQYFKQLAISIHVRESGRRSLVRVKTAVNGQTEVNKAAIDEIWLLMQRQVLMSPPDGLGN